MIIPYFNYECVLSIQFYFSIAIMILYLIVAFPGTNKYVGSYLGLHNYDNVTSNDRYYLLFVHSIVMSLLTYILLMVYNPGKLH